MDRSSVSNAESVIALDSEGEGSTRGINALALAGPVVTPIANYRYSADYTEPTFPPKNNVSTFHYIFRLANCILISLKYSLRCTSYSRPKSLKWTQNVKKYLRRVSNESEQLKKNISYFIQYGIFSLLFLFIK